MIKKYISGLVIVLSFCSKMEGSDSQIGGSDSDKNKNGTTKALFYEHRTWVSNFTSSENKESDSKRSSYFDKIVENTPPQEKPQTDGIQKALSNDNKMNPVVNEKNEEITQQECQNTLLKKNIKNLTGSFSKSPPIDVKKDTKESFFFVTEENQKESQRTPLYKNKKNSLNIEKSKAIPYVEATENFESNWEGDGYSFTEEKDRIFSKNIEKTKNSKNNDNNQNKVTHSLPNLSEIILDPLEIYSLNTFKNLEKKKNKTDLLFDLELDEEKEDIYFTSH